MTRTRYGPLAAAVCLGTAASFGIFALVRTSERGRVEAEFERDAHNYASSVTRSFETKLLILNSLRSLFVVSGPLHPHEFQAFTDPILLQMPDVRALDWVPRVSRADRADHEATMRARGAAAYQILERNESGAMVVAGDRPVYFPVTEVGPEEARDASTGYDLGSDPIRFEAMQRARDSGSAVATAPLTLVQETEGQYGLLVFVPIYRDGPIPEDVDTRRANLQGFVLGVYRIPDIIESALSYLRPAGLEVSLYDVSHAPPLRLYTHRAAAQSISGARGTALPVHTTPFAVGQRRWELRCKALPEFITAHESQAPFGALFGGLLFTAVFAARLQTNSDRAHALTSANESLQRQGTERKQISDSLRESERQLQSILDTTLNHIVVLALDGTVLYINRAFEGLPRERVVGRNVYDYLSPPNVATLHHAVDQVTASLKPVEFELEMLSRGNGNDRAWYLCCAAPQTIDGKAEKLTLCALDITERKKSEAEGARLTAAVEQVAAGTLITDSDGVIEYVNPAFERLTGYTRAEAVGQTPRLLRSGHHDAAFYESLWGALLEGAVWRGRFINKRKDGTLYEQDAVITPVYDRVNGSLRYVEVFDDASDRAALETQLRQAQKMEAIGLLAGGIAHDFNNLLTAILGSADLAEARLERGGDPRSEIAGIRTAAERAAELTRQLLAFGRKQVLQPRVTDLNAAVRETLTLLRRVIPEDIELLTDLAPDLDAVTIDRGQMQQVLTNLTVNARDAMPDGGRITIATSNITAHSRQSMEHPDARGEAQVLLSVTDTGIGMDASTAAHAFEPFFTTKPAAKGTGLGLSTVFGIVKQSEGHISVSSQMGQGSVFRIYLRRHSGPLTTVQSTTQPTLTGRGESILLVEDDEHIRAMARRILESNGYSVHDAPSAEEALRAAAEMVPAADLVLTDIVLPGIRGTDLAARLARDHPTMRLLFMTGYADRTWLQRSDLPADWQLLEKPFRANDLLQKVRSVLDHKR
jgi:PAS domain S-box-containing protein